MEVPSEHSAPPTWKLTLNVEYDDPLYEMTGIEPGCPPEMEVEVFFPTLEDLLKFVEGWAMGVRLVM